MSVIAVMLIVLALGWRWVWRDAAKGYHAFEMELQRLRTTRTPTKGEE
jgi:hypothetical protein